MTPGSQYTKFYSNCSIATKVRLSLPNERTTRRPSEAAFGSAPSPSAGPFYPRTDSTGARARQWTDAMGQSAGTDMGTTSVKDVRVAFLAAVQSAGMRIDSTTIFF